MLLKGLNIGDEPKLEDKIPEFNQGPGNHLTQNNQRAGSNKNSYNSHQNKQARSEK